MAFAMRPANMFPELDLVGSVVLTDMEPYNRQTNIRPGLSFFYGCSEFVHIHKVGAV